MRLPQKHIADSVIDRILAAAQRIAPANPVALQGQQLDQALQQPVGDVATIDGLEDNIVARSLDL